jgi:LPXTG-motif cell wall-anchored protein
MDQFCSLLGTETLVDQTLRRVACDARSAGSDQLTKELKTKGERMRSTTIAISIFLIALGSALAPRAKADAWDQLTKMTFSGPVEIPGQVLPAGTYWFKLLDSPSDRNIVQIMNEKQDKVISTLLAIPDYRLKPSDKTVITFEERASGSPPAVKAWFYPGDNYGQEFVYPKIRAAELAKRLNQPVPSMPENLEATTKAPIKSPKEPAVMALKKAPVKVEKPSGGEEEITEIVTTPPQLLAQNKPPAQSSTPTPARLPSTGSELPLIGLLGALFAGAGLVLRFAARRVN